MLTRLVLVLILFAFTQGNLLAADSTTRLEPKINGPKPVQLSPGVYDVAIVLPPSLEKRRSEFRQNFINAQTNLRIFAKRNGWEHLTDEPFVRQIEIYDTKSAWDNRLRQFFLKDAPAVIPKEFSATIEREVFFSVSPETYNANYPAGREANAFEKLIIHELAHRLHVRICKGEEEKMGPIWFFEGFAIYAANQLNNHMPNLSNAEIWSIVNAKVRGSYQKYNVVFRHFLKNGSISEYVQKAGEPKFTEWLKRRE